MVDYQKDDILFAGASVVDGSGKRDRYVADVLVRDGYIKSIIQERGKSNHANAQEKGVRVVD